MRKHIIIPALAILLVSAFTASAEDKNSDEKVSDFHCYRAWKKQLKKDKKEYKAKYMCAYRPWAAERKMRKASKKAWKRDMLEQEHGYDHGFWYWH